MSKCPKIQELKITGSCKDIYCFENKFITADKDNKITIENLCTLPYLMNDIFSITVKGDLLYVVYADTAIIVINLLDISIVNLYEDVHDVVKEVVFSERFINIITLSCFYYKTPYENINLQKVNYASRPDENLRTLEEIEQRNSLYEKALLENNSPVCVERIVISKDEKYIIYVDVFGTVYNNGVSILSIIEHTNYIYIIQEDLYLLVEDTLIIYSLQMNKVIEKKPINNFKLAAGPFILSSNLIIDLSTMCTFKVPMQIETLFYSNGRLFFNNSEALYEVLL